MKRKQSAPRTQTGLGIVVRALRESRGWSQAQLAVAADLSGQSTVGMLESGGRKRGTSETVKKIARAFGLTVDDVLAAAERVDAGDTDIEAWLAARQQRKDDADVIDVQAREVREQPPRAQSPGVAGRVSVREALPVVLEAMRACPHRDELRTLLTLLIDIDAEPYRARLMELLDAQGAARLPAQTKRREDAAPEETNHAIDPAARPTGAR